MVSYHHSTPAWKKTHSTGSHRLPVGLVIVVRDEWAYLRACLESVRASSWVPSEVIIVVNGRTQARSITLGFATLRVIEMGSNQGPALARNAGVRSCTERYVAFLDPDTIVDPDWLLHSCKTLDDDPSIGGVQSKLLMVSQPDSFDYVGDYMTDYGFLKQIASVGEKDDGQHDSVKRIFALKSAAAIFRRDAIISAGLFDGDFFVYGEETDLCWRLQLIGYKIVFEPRSRVFHDFPRNEKIRNPFRTYLSKFHGTKNYIIMNLKNQDLFGMIFVVPIHLAIWIAVLLWHVKARRTNEARLIIGAFSYVLTHVPSIAMKRRTIWKISKSWAVRQLYKSVCVKTTPRYFYLKWLSRGSGWLEVPASS